MQRNRPDLEQRWESVLVALREYKQAAGGTDVPRTFRTSDGRTLGAWLHRQRSLWAAGRLPDDREQRLAGEGVRWRVNDRSRATAALRAYLAEYGDLRVPADYVAADGTPLGTWVQSRRADYRRNQSQTLQLWPELAELPFEWKQREDLWARGVTALERYGRDYGDVRVPHWFETEDGMRLGLWLDTRRTEYRAGLLAADRVDALEALGVEWSLRVIADTTSREAREDAHFLAMLDAAVDWLRQHDGLAPRVREIDPEGRAVGRWFARLRSQVAAGKVPNRRLPLIEDAFGEYRTTADSGNYKKGRISSRRLQASDAS